MYGSDEGQSPAPSEAAQANHLPRLSHATVGECYRAGFKEEKRLRRLATETEYIVTRTKIHCDKEPPIFDFSDWK